VQIGAPLSLAVSHFVTQTVRRSILADLAEGGEAEDAALLRA
jgi:hypothetical protein